MPKPERCPYCGAKESLVSVGPGVERVEEEARERFGDARIAVFSSDTVPSAEAARAVIGAMTEGEIDILIATQAAAKGHNFPHLTLVGVVGADARGVLYGVGRLVRQPDPSTQSDDSSHKRRCGTWERSISIFLLITRASFYFSRLSHSGS